MIPALFAPCKDYMPDPRPGLRRRLRHWLRGEPEPSCCSCALQFRPEAVCAVFQERLEDAITGRRKGRIT